MRVQERPKNLSYMVQPPNDGEIALQTPRTEAWLVWLQHQRSPILEFTYTTGRHKLVCPIETVNRLKRVLGECLDARPEVDFARVGRGAYKSTKLHKMTTSLLHVSCQDYLTFETYFRQVGQVRTDRRNSWNTSKVNSI